MKSETKNIIIVFEFIIIISIFFIINILKPDDKISVYERRKLASFPEISLENIFEGNISNQLEEYAMDQFVSRDVFRKIKYYFNTNILKQKDTNKFFIKNDGIYKIEYPLNEIALKKSTQKINNVIDKYLKGMNICYAVIPDKNYYLQDEYLKIDYDKFISIVKDELKDIKYIDLFSELSIEDYYRTDLHWKQESLENVASKISLELNSQNRFNSNYEKIKLGNFYGTYYGQALVDVNPDNLIYLNNDIIENCITYNYENKKANKVYDLEKYENSNDKYDIFVSGATSLISIENPNAKTSKELIIFRDSFGSSIAPLLLENYSKITLIDLRYINSKILNDFIEFKNQDVLFLYSTILLNQDILK